MKLAAAFPNSEICRRIAHAATDVCAGEIIQTQRRFDLNLTIGEYFQVIEMKTPPYSPLQPNWGRLSAKQVLK